MHIVLRASSAARLWASASRTPRPLLLGRGSWDVARLTPAAKHLSTGAQDRTAFRAAVADWRSNPTSPLRFPLGAPVKCLIGSSGEWATGRVVKHDHNEPDFGVVPYQILLDGAREGEQSAVWAPADIDECVRAAQRFAVGDSVECCVNADLGLWARGTVVRHFFREAKWPEGRYAPYQIKVESFFDETTGKEHAGAFIWAPEDSDACIRKARPGGQ